MKHSPAMVGFSPYGYEECHPRILLAYILLGHPDWKTQTIKIHAVFPKIPLMRSGAGFSAIQTGQLPSSPKTIGLVAQKISAVTVLILLMKNPTEADLTIVGLWKAVGYPGIRPLTVMGELEMCFS